MWEQEIYEEHSEFLDFPARMVTPKPYQYPHPPVWMAANAEEGARIAGGDGCGLLCFTLLQPLGKLKPVIDAQTPPKQAVVETSSGTFCHDGPILTRFRSGGRTHLTMRSPGISTSRPNG